MMEPYAEFIRRGVQKVTTADGSIACYIKYIGSEASGKIAFANTTGDISCTHGAVGSEVADTTVNPNGGTAGTIDLSAEAATFAALKAIFDATPNWELIPAGYLPGDATEASGTAKILNNIAATSAKIDGGYPVYFDRSASLYHGIGITNCRQSSVPHCHDGQVRHIIDYIAVTLTYSSGTHTIYVYEVDDVAASSTQLFSTAAAATTVAFKLPVSGTPDPTFTAESKRLVLKQISSTAEPTVWDFEVHYESWKLGPGMNKKKLYSNE
jgi:hypothetical protein